MKTSGLHTAPDRRERFAGLDPKIWLETSLLRTWVVAEPTALTELLRSPHAAILSIEDMLGAIERAYGVDLPSVRFAARHLPLFLDGETHIERRRSFSRYLAGRLPEIEKRLPELARQHLRAFRTPGVVELVSEVTGPFVRALNEIFVGSSLPRDIGSLELLDLFALNKSVTRFKDLDHRVRQAIECLGVEGRGDENIGNRFTALIMGFETLMTMLTEGLISAFREEPARSGGLVALPSFPIETGVPISYRKALRDFEWRGHACKANDLFRLQLQTIGYSAREADRKWMFGAGAHSCVGKQASLIIWQALQECFNALKLRGILKSCTVKPSHYLVRRETVFIEVTG